MIETCTIVYLHILYTWDNFNMPGGSPQGLRINVIVTRFDISAGIQKGNKLIGTYSLIYDSNI